MTKPEYNAKLESLRMEMLVARVSRLLIGLALLLVVLEFVIHRHGNLSLEDLPLFPPLFAILTSILIIGLSFCVNAVLGRDEDYYGDSDDG